MTLLQIAQAGITLFGVTAFLLVTREESKYQKLGVVGGLLSNPFWWMMVIATEQWITIPVHLLYTYGWLRKGWVLWLKKEKKVPMLLTGEAIELQNQLNKTHQILIENARKKS